MKRTLILLVLSILAACAGVPAPGGGELQPLTFGTDSNDSVLGTAAYGGGVYAVGETFGDLHGPARGGGDAFIRKYASSGRVLWGRQFGSSAFDTALGAAAGATRAALTDLGIADDYLQQLGESLPAGGTAVILLADVRAPEPVAVVLSEPSDPDRPKRAGWWSRTKAALTGE